MFSPIKFLDNYSIPFYTTGYRQCSSGWINLDCPFCRANPYLGINLKSGAVNCYQCGTHSQTQLISELLRISFYKAEEIRKEYTDDIPSYISKSKTKIQSKTHLDLPYGSDIPCEKHKEYLKKRGFDPDKIIQEWNLSGTGHLGDYRGRIIAPIFLNEKLVSYQGRDITGRQMPKYRACAKENEIIHHKHYLYGLWKTEISSPIIVVEGIFDVWKLGPGSVATFGIQWRREQAILLLSFPKIFILFDPEAQAQKQAEKLADFLSIMGKSIVILDHEKYDPGDMNQKEADFWMKKIMHFSN